MKPGQDIVISKWIGLEATTILAKEKEEELRTVFSEEFIRRAQEFDRYLSVLVGGQDRSCMGSVRHA